MYSIRVQREYVRDARTTKKNCFYQCFLQGDNLFILKMCVKSKSDLNINLLLTKYVRVVYVYHHYYKYSHDSIIFFI